MMRSMRQQAKWIFYILAVAFIGWLVLQGVNQLGFGGGAAGGDIVLKVNGTPVHAPQYQQAVQTAFEQYRQQTGNSPQTQEDERDIENQVVNQMEQDILLRQEYSRLGITVTDQEIRDAARTSPPPEVLRAPEFQTDSQFDIRKWQTFLNSNVDPSFLQALESRYRDQIPQQKLAEYLTSDIYVSDAKLWRMYRDQHDSVKISVVAIRPEMIPDQDAQISDAELAAFFAKHKDDFKRPAEAFLSFIAQPRYPNAADSAAALRRADSLRAVVVAGGAAKFAEVAKQASSDSGSGAQGGDLGWLKRNQQGYDPQFLAGLKPLAVGQVSKPVLSSFGYHIIRVDAAKGDSVRVRHILVPVDLVGAHLDYVDARADTLDRTTAEQTDGTLLDSAARKFNLPLAKAPPLLEGDRLTLGRFAIPDVSVWAFTAKVGETSPVIEGTPAYYVFRLDSLHAEGVPPLAEIRDRVLFSARMQKKKDLAQVRAGEVAAKLKGATDLASAATALGIPPETLGPFTRLSPPAQLQQEPEVIGAAFGLRVGERSGLIQGEAANFLVQSLYRKLADSSAWLAQRDQQRSSLLQPARQARIQQYLAALKARAKIVDRRKELLRAQPAGS